MHWTADSVRKQYSRFLDKYPHKLFANHSHQAWPNVARFGLLKCFDLAAETHGDKWAEVELTRKKLQAWVSKRIGNSSYGGAKGVLWGQNTFDLLTRFLSSLDLKRGDYIVTTDTEFHSMRRLLDRLSEEGIEVLRADTWTASEAFEGQTGKDFFSRLDQELRKVPQGKLKAVMFSSVSFHTGNLVPNFDEGLEKLLAMNVPIVVDLYHHIGPKTFSVPSKNQDNLYLLGGGYKYLQMGEGACWMRTPEHTELRPVITGWFAEFEELTESKDNLVSYPEGAARFMGATYEPASILRAWEVAQFFDGIGFTNESLEKKYTKDVSYLHHRLQGILDRIPNERKAAYELFMLSHKDENLRAGFLSLHSSLSGELHKFLLDSGFETDYRSTVIRFGPAPYTLKLEMDHLMDKVSEFFDGRL
ncbi:MAG: hypothetical protein AB8E15_08425 [Bdellovibrionales bacterium]